MQQSNPIYDIPCDSKEQYDKLIETYRNDPLLKSKGISLSNENLDHLVADGYEVFKIPHFDDTNQTNKVDVFVRKLEK